VNPMTNHYEKLPFHMIDSLIRYIENGEHLGGFLTAILCNDLFKAVSRADEQNLSLLPLYVRYIYNELPIASYGTLEKVKAWMKENGGENKNDE
jgi:hypothetical protein